jgi:DNA-binding NarL/FixJ family response regulator
MPPIRVLLVDDHAVVRAGIRTLLEQMPGVRVVGEAGNGQATLQLLKARAEAVDVVLLDVSMEEGDGIVTAGYIAKEYPHLRVLMLSMHTAATYVLPAVQAGAAGYVPKSATPAELEQALKAVARGETYLSPAVAQHVTAGYRRARAPQHAPSPDSLAPEFLRPHERELLQLIAAGHANKDIAARLHISPKALESRRLRLMERLDIHDVPGLMRYAIRMGIVSIEE